MAAPASQEEPDEPWMEHDDSVELAAERALARIARVGAKELEAVTSAEASVAHLSGP